MAPTVTILDEISVNTFLSSGPLLDVNNSDKIFDSQKHLGVPYEMELHSSINGMYRYGSISFFDDGGIRESLPLTGNEIITIMYRNAYKTDSGSQPTIIHFNIFDIEEETYYPTAMDSKRFTTKLLKFHIIECPFFLLYNQNLWQKSYGKDTGEESSSEKIFIDKIFEDHLIKDLKIYNPNNKNNLFELNLQKMSTKMHFFSPSWKSQMIFSYLLDYCRDENGYGNVKFYNTTNNANGKIKINLQSLNQMFKNQKVVEFVNLDTSALSNFQKDNSTFNNRVLNQIIKHRFIYYDISSIPAGLAGAYMLNMDYKNSQYYTLYDTYENSNSKKENSYFSNFAMWRNEISNENTKQYFIGEFPKEHAKKYLNNKIIKNKYQLRCEMMTYVDEAIHPGDKISAIFISGMTEYTRDKQNHLFDEHMSDEWIVEDVVDTFKNGKAIRKMVVVKDSFFNIYDKSAGASSQLPVPKVIYVNKKG